MPYDEGGEPVRAARAWRGRWSARTPRTGVLVKARVPASAASRFERFAVNGARSNGPPDDAALRAPVEARRGAAAAHEGDAGYDLRAAESARSRPGERASVGTGIAVAIPDGHAGLVLPRSGLAARHGISLVNAPGLIDAGYRGEVRVLLLNTDRDATVRGRVRATGSPSSWWSRRRGPELEEVRRARRHRPGRGRLRLQRALKPGNPRRGVKVPCRGSDALGRICRYGVRERSGQAAPAGVTPCPDPSAVRAHGAGRIGDVIVELGFASREAVERRGRGARARAARTGQTLLEERRGHTRPARARGRRALRASTTWTSTVPAGPRRGPPWWTHFVLRRYGRFRSRSATSARCSWPPPTRPTCSRSTTWR